MSMSQAAAAAADVTNFKNVPDSSTVAPVVELAAHTAIAPAAMVDPNVNVPIAVDVPPTVGSCVTVIVSASPGSA